MRAILAENIIFAPLALLITEASPALARLG